MASQLTVFIENRPGALAQMTGVLAEEEINIESIMVEGEHDFGFARIRAHPIREAERILQDAGFQVRKGDVLTLALPNKPGALHHTLEKLAEAEVNIENLYGTADGGEEPELVILVDDVQRARDVLGLE